MTKPLKPEPELPKKLARYQHRGARSVRAKQRRRQLATAMLNGKSPREVAPAIGLAPKTAASLASTPAVQTLVDAGMTRAAERAELSAAQVIRELGRIGLFNVGSMFDQHGRLQPVALWDESIKHVVSSFEVLRPAQGADQLIRVKFWSKTEALRILADHLGLLRHLDLVQEKPVDMSVYTDEELRILAALARKGVAGAERLLPAEVTKDDSAQD